MSDTICGLDRRALASALKYAATEGVTSDMIAHMAVIAGEPVRSCFAVIDVPAKMAEMLAERGRQLGFDAAWATESIGSVWGRVEFVAFDDCIVLRVPSSIGKLIFSRRMPQARALLAAWLALPDGDRVGAENALRSVT